MKYRPEIDGLRAVAVLPVILFHAGFETFRGGFVGVDIFFVISGYLITSIILGEIATGRFSIATFYERRARRILPALFTVCFACIPFAWLWMSTQEYRDFSQSLLAVLTFSSNVLFWLKTNYFEPGVDLKPLLHTWSLAVEEQFYLFFPLLLVFVNKVKPAAIAGVVALVSAMSLGLAIHAADANAAANFYLIPTRAWELGVGALLAFPAFQRPFNASVSTLGAVIGMGMIGFAVFRFSEATPFPSEYALVPVIGAALVIAFSGEDRIVGAVLRSKLMVAIGLVSYSLYLWHQPVLAFTRLRFESQLSRSSALAALTLTTLLAVFTWKYIENPFRNKQLISLPTLSKTATAFAVVLAVAGLAGHVSRGFQNVGNARVQLRQNEDRLRPNYGLSDKCQGSFTLASECRTSEEPELMLWGDSYAMHLAAGIVASKPQAKMIQFTKSMCGPVLDLAPMNGMYPRQWAKGCLQFNEQVLDWLSKHRSVKYVVLSSPLDQYVSDVWRLHTREGVRDAAVRVAAEKFVTTLDRIEALGVVPVVISPTPSSGADIGRCLLGAQHLGLDPARCNFSRTASVEHQQRERELLKEIERTHPVLWLDDFICSAGDCLASVDGIFIYRDRGHLSREGSEFLGKKIGLYDRIVAAGHRNDGERRSDRRESGALQALEH